MKQIMRITTTLAIVFWAIASTRAQLVYTSAWGNVITISSDKGGVCGAPTGTNTYPFVYDNGAVILDAFKQVPPGQYFKAKYGEPVTITVEIRNPNGLSFSFMDPFTALIGTDAPPYLYDVDNAKGTDREIEYKQFSQIPVAVRHKLTLSFARADTKAWVIIRQLVDYTERVFILPFVVEGVLNEQTPIPILGTTTQPQLPYFVLHAPPGDGSTAEFQESKTVCREITQSAATDNSNSGYVDVKVGIAGSAGFIVTTSFEFSVTVGASTGSGQMRINTKGNQTCLTVTEGFQTPPGGEDVFVGYGLDLAYGVSSRVAIDSNTCTAYLHPIGLVCMPVGQPRQFYYTKSEILDQIAQQQVLMDDTSLTVRVRTNAQNQIDVWRKILAMNEANVNNPANATLGAVSFGTVPSSQESSISVSQTASIEYEQYVDYSASLDVVVEVAGSGVSGGYEYRGSQRYGKIENQSQDLTRMVRYTLSDDDPGDLFNVNIVRDPMFGTPIFRIAPGTKSACPYQGGYQRDQPRLKHDGSSDTHITLQGTPVGSSAVFKLDLCNESNEARTYNLKLNAQSNLNGAVVSAAGVPLNGNDLGQTFTIPANSCIQDLVVEVKQLSLNSPLAYPNLELFLYSPCEETIQSSIFASVYFGNATGTREVADHAALRVWPNPSTGAIQVGLPEGEHFERVQVLDLSGRVLMDLQEPASGSNAALDLSNLPKGFFILQARTEKHAYSRKVVLE